MSGEELKKQADSRGICEALTMLGREVRVELPLDRELLEQPVLNLNLSVRSGNALMRANVKDVAGLVRAIMSESGIQCIRNLGKTSAREIRAVLLTEGYSRLDESGKLNFWNRVAEVNGL